MPHHCQFVPPHVLNHIARVQAREGLEPSAAQRSAVVSAQIRRFRENNLVPGLTGPVADVPRAEGIAPGLQFPATASAGRLIYDDLNQWNFDVNFVRGEGDPAVAGENANRAYDYLAKLGPTKSARSSQVWVQVASPASLVNCARARW
jgi:hypothetical protein